MVSKYEFIKSVQTFAQNQIMSANKYRKSKLGIEYLEYDYISFSLCNQVLLTSTLIQFLSLLQTTTMKTS